VESLKCSNCAYRPNIQISEYVIAQLCVSIDRKCTINELMSFNFTNWKNIENRECAHCGNYLQCQSLNNK